MGMAGRARLSEAKLLLGSLQAISFSFRWGVVLFARFIGCNLEGSKRPRSSYLWGSVGGLFKSGYIGRPEGHFDTLFAGL